MSPPLHRARVALRAVKRLTSRTPTDDAAERGESVSEYDQGGPWTPGLTGHTGLADGWNGTSRRGTLQARPLQICNLH